MEKSIPHSPFQVPVYMAGQYLGAFFAALVLWGEYADAIKMVSMVYDLLLCHHVPLPRWRWTSPQPTQAATQAPHTGYLPPTLSLTFIRYITHITAFISPRGHPGDHLEPGLGPDAGDSHAAHHHPRSD